MSEWASPKVVAALVRDVVGVPSKVWIGRYFIARQFRALRWLAPSVRELSWHSTGTALTVSPLSGGLSAWYEVAHVEVYAPVPDFMPRPGWTVIDIGANIGAYATWAAALIGPTGTLVAIEPNPVSFGHLEQSIASFSDRVRILDRAAGDTDGELPLHFTPGFTGTSSLLPNDQATDVVQVRVERLDRTRHDLDMSHVDLIKIDVEGSEAAVLRGALDVLSVTDRVVLETSSDSDEAEVRRVLAGCGFELVHERPRIWDMEELRILAFKRRKDSVDGPDGPPRPQSPTASDMDSRWPKGPLWASNWIG